ncbi:ABC transporter ATP-binding protein [Aminobacter sp. AP02]|uniref:ABC transporter ATP-binding protein n=1 Tax=Aminobacter sp. AP02 TaxID=2135737 RepID=UPI000D7946A9|nr:ABC transporter ATP-binding protein [Aminobacter sp. AP02]PWK59990.1 peptide/nickel transport system ATP-binding protein [Aminobacter sp. AP02]
MNSLTSVSAGPEALLSVAGLTTELRTRKGTVHALHNVGFTVRPGEAIAIVGESGCGKSMTARSIMRVLPRPIDKVSGYIRFGGTDLLTLSDAAMGRIRGARIAMIFQDPMSHLDPLMRIGDQIAEVVRAHKKLAGGALQQAVREALTAAQIAEIDRVMSAYPHQLSGGLRQRALIAMALACEPQLLIADEPTTALDVTTQKQILQLLRQLVTERQMGLVLITHDLGVVANVCDRVYVMYAGQVIEHADVHDFFERPQHPYSQGLLASLKSLSEGNERLSSIPGVVPNLIAPPSGCRFRARCQHALDICAVQDPTIRLCHDNSRDAACWLVAGKGDGND